jgi:serine/threonine protein kinase/Flp pilus assembly protein TadD
MRHTEAHGAARVNGDAAQTDEATARVFQAVEEYLAALEAGRAPSREEFLGRHADVASRLGEYLDGLELIHRAGSAAGAASGGGAAGDDLSGAEPLGDFLLVREVGRGGMGVVYEAEQRSLGRRVALKVLPFAATMDPRALKRFQNEARAAASLDHPHIVHVHAVGCERGVHYYAMQFVDGQTLAALIADLRRRSGRPAPTEDQPTTSHAHGEAAPLAETAPRAAASTERARLDRAHYRRVAELGIQAAEALDHAHQLGILHRDVKPANLLVDGRGGLWVTDFGLAQVQSDARLTMTGDLVGTLRYMSPEQALAQRVVIDHRTDVYSLGATLYELLTLEPAFAGNDRQELLRLIAFEEPKAPRRLDKAIPAELETIVLKAMEKNPAERYAAANELADDLRRWLADEPIRAQRAGVLRRLGKWSRRHRAAVVATVTVLALALVMLGGAAGWLVQQRAAAETKADETLEAAAPGLREGNPWDPALMAAAQRAEALLGSGLLGPQSRRRVEQLQKDAQMLAALERIRLDRGEVRDGYFFLTGRDPRYAPAFREYGIDMEAPGPEAPAAFLQRSAIREHLVAALDDWAAGLAIVGGDEPTAQAKQLLAVARQVDPDPWRNRLRDMVQSREVGDLARTAPIEELPRATLGLLGLWVVAAADSGGLKVLGPPQQVLEPTLEVLRRAQQRFPADFWINHNLATLLTFATPYNLDEAIGFHRAAVALRPQSAHTRFYLGERLRQKRKLDPAIAEYRRVIELDPEFAYGHWGLGAALREKGSLDRAIAEFCTSIKLKADIPAPHNDLGIALAAKGEVEGAIAEFRTAIRLKADSPQAHTNLGNALRDNGEVEGAIAEHRKAISLKANFPEAHMNLGSALRDKGDVEGAIAEYRTAIRLKAGFPEAHLGLGNVLRTKGDVAGAIAELRKAIKLKANYAEAHCDIGHVLGDKGDVEGAIAEYRTAIKLKADYPVAHGGLGHVLYAKGDVAGAIAEYRTAIDLDPKDARFHGSLGLAMWRQGHFAEARTATRRALELLPQHARIRQGVTQQLQQCERLVELDRKLPAILSGKEQPASAAERADYAGVCLLKRHYVAAVRLYREAITAQADLVSSPAKGIRNNAACAAALASCGAGADASKLTNTERAALRKQALDYLRADLDLRRAQLEKEPTEVAKKMRHWLDDSDFTGVRGPDALAKLPDAERADWQKLWADVQRLLDRAADKPPRPTDGAKKP